jgi:hypothetical protein
VAFILKVCILLLYIINPKLEGFHMRIASLKGLAVLTACVGVGASASAQAINCNLVLDENLFDRRSLAVSERLISGMKSNVCSEEFTSHEQAKQYIREGGWELDVFGWFDNSLRDNKQEQTGNYSVQRSEFCANSVSDIARSFGSDYRQVSGKFALEAFEACVERTQSNVLYVTYLIPSVAPNNPSILQGDLVRVLLGEGEFPYEIRGFSTSPDEADIDCKLRTSQIPDDLATNPLRVDSSPAKFTCVRRDDIDTFIEITTTQGDFTVLFPSSETVRINELAALASRIVKLENNAVDLQKTVERRRFHAGVDRWINITNNDGVDISLSADICSLTSVDDNISQACLVRERDGSRWQYRTVAEGAESGAPNCEVACLTLDAQLR